MTDAELVALRDDIARRWGEEVAQEVVLHLLAQSSHVADPRAWCYSDARKRCEHAKRWQRRHVPLPEDGAFLTDTDEYKGDTYPQGLCQPPDQLARLEAAEDIALAPPCLIEEAEGRRRLTRQRRGQARRQFRRRLRAREETHK